MSTTTPLTAKITPKPSGSGSLNLPADTLEALDCPEGGTVAILIEDRSIRIVPLGEYLIPSNDRR